MSSNIHELFLQLVRLGVGRTERSDVADNVDWAALKALADSQGLNAVVLDGLDFLSTNT